jgi:excisionase family DNA binding protein
MKFLTYRELGEELSLSVRYLQKCVQQGSLPCIRFGKAVRFDPKAVAEWIYKQNQKLKAVSCITNSERAISRSQ